MQTTQRASVCAIFSRKLRRLKLRLAQPLRVLHAKNVSLSLSHTLWYCTPRMSDAHSHGARPVHQIISMIMPASPRPTPAGTAHQECQMQIMLTGLVLSQSVPKQSQGCAQSFSLCNVHENIRQAEASPRPTPAGTARRECQMHATHRASVCVFFFRENCTGSRRETLEAKKVRIMVCGRNVFGVTCSLRSIETLTFWKRFWNSWILLPSSFDQHHLTIIIIISSSSSISTTEAEYNALSESVKLVMYLRAVLEDIGREQTVPTPIGEDNEGCLHLL